MYVHLCYHGNWIREPMPDQFCLYSRCQKKFTPKRPWQKFCDRLCRDRYWNLVNPRMKALLRTLNEPESVPLLRQIQEHRENLRAAPLDSK